MSGIGFPRSGESVVRRSRPRSSALTVIAVLVILGLNYLNQQKQGPGPAPAPAPVPAPIPAPGGSPQPTENTFRVKRVVDGDTLLLDNGVRVRLLGVNTPEIPHDDKPAEPLGYEAADFTRRLVEGKDVTLEYDKERVDDYGRTLAYVYIDGRMLNETLIEEGFSQAVTRHPYRSDRKKLFEAAEVRARAKKIGFWSLPGRDGGSNPRPNSKPVRSPG